MRPQQQNRRMRGRNNNNNNGSNNNNNNNRRGPNPLTRSYESNGPDVKIRGSAQQIAEKYTTLARDAMSSGDRVVAENYLQHAEHYNRIIAAAQAQMPQPNQQSRNEGDDEGDEDGDEMSTQSNGNAQQDQPQFNGNRQSDQRQDSQSNSDVGSGPQPVIVGTPAEVALSSDRQGNDERAAGGQLNGNESESQPAAAEGEEAPRRPRRPRRSRKAVAADANAGEQGDANANAPASAEAPGAKSPDAPSLESADS
ncbi:MAG: DUF4167 domain-containing protein [Rhizobiaceae bacterium]|nr:DUF4167 domain-containing protein [Rhizobiaceae bacterium]